jgi:hypothetical protein
MFSTFALINFGMFWNPTNVVPAEYPPQVQVSGIGVLFVLFVQ